ncbi:MAG: phosphotransferase [Candidatus Moraniibacteriota bacterium]
MTIEEYSGPGKYADSDEYQREIARQYATRVSKFSREQVVEVLKMLEIANVPTADEIAEAGAGNVNATYVTDRLVIKLNREKDHPDYFANTIVSDRFADRLPVVRVIAYDYFERTPFEALVMRRMEGRMLLEDILEMSEGDREVLFRQVLDVVGHLFGITFSDFGRVNLDGRTSFTTYAEYLVAEFEEHVRKIRSEHLCSTEDIGRIEEYFRRHIHVFDEGESVFVHTDTHMGNILHEGTKLTALLDFDSSLKAPKVRALNSLIGFIDNPQQFVEGTKDFAKFKGKSFHHLLPLLESAFPDVFTDPFLLRKLNLISVSEGVMWVSQNWSDVWNAEMIRGLVDNELPEDDLSGTYHGRILSYL